MKLPIRLSLASFVFMSIFVGTPVTYGQECASVLLENGKTDNRFVQLRLSNQEGCVAVYGFYVQIERNGSVQEITSTPSGWTYGDGERSAFWITESEPVDSESKVFGMKLQTQRPYTFHWIALDQSLSPIAEGVLTG
ncbi:MAG: hypothetical protein ACRD38_10045 [Nitrososphaerales archaeon]